jgi:predicted dehydrogenase
MYKEELRHLVACIRGDLARPLVDGEQGAAVLAVALAAVRSAATGHTINFDTDTDATTQRWLRHLGPAA